jgi:hypothetical protein
LRALGLAAFAQVADRSDGGTAILPHGTVADALAAASRERHTHTHAAAARATRIHTRAHRHAGACQAQRPRAAVLSIGLYAHSLQARARGAHAHHRPRPPAHRRKGRRRRHRCIAPQCRAAPCRCDAVRRCAQSAPCGGVRPRAMPVRPSAMPVRRRGMEFGPAPRRGGRNVGLALPRRLARLGGGGAVFTHRRSASCTSSRRSSRSRS